MEQVSIIGIDLAKSSFQLHGARVDGSVAFRKKLSRTKLLDFLAAQPCCVVAMEACASAHYWGRETEKLGHEIKLVPPIYVKQFSTILGDRNARWRTRVISCSFIFARPAISRTVHASPEASWSNHKWA